MITRTMFLASERDQDINDGRLCERQTREKTGSNSSKGFPEGNVSSKRDASIVTRYTFLLSLLQTHQTDPLEPMFMEDLAALETLTEDTILDELHERLRQGYYHSFIGDILLILNPNEQQDIYGSDVRILHRSNPSNEIPLIIDTSLDSSITQNINSSRDRITRLTYTL